MAITMYELTHFNIAGNNYELSQPEWLWLIPLYIIVNLILISIKNKHLSTAEPANLGKLSGENQHLYLHPLISLLPLNTKTLKQKPAQYLFYTFIFVLLVLALTQPVRVGEKLPDPPQERDIVFIVDASVSMILRDYILNGERIDRMSLLKGVLDSFIHKLRGERMSIIVFGDHAYTLVPLTDDQLLLRQMLKRIQATVAGRFNAMGEAIALAVKQATKESNKRKRILVLLTDADQPTGKIDPKLAAELARQANIPLYTIAIGATSLAAEESRQGGLLYSPVDRDLIQALSDATGAKSYQAGNPQALENAIQAISLHESNKRKVKPVYFRQALYYWLLITAFVLVTIRQLINIFITDSLRSSLLQLPVFFRRSEK